MVLVFGVVDLNAPAQSVCVEGNRRQDPPDEGLANPRKEELGRPTSRVTGPWSTGR